MIKSQEIIDISNRLKVDRKIIEQDYFITWILFGLAQDRLKNKVAFKGGTALKKCYFPKYRFSEDLDFHWLWGKKDWKEIIEGFKRILNKIEALSANKMEISEPAKRGEVMEFFINGQSILNPNLFLGIKVDIVNGIELVDKLLEKKGFLDYSDFPDREVKLKVYSLYEIISEKLFSLLESMRWEPRDLYDIWYLLNFANLDVKLLKQKFRRKSGFEPDPQLIIQSIEEPVYKKLWKIRLENQIHDLPPIEKAIEDIKKFFRKH